MYVVILSYWWQYNAILFRCQAYGLILIATDSKANSNKHEQTARSKRTVGKQMNEKIADSGEQLSEHLHTPREAATAIGVESHTLRRWCNYHDVHLSLSATDNTQGRARRFTWADIETLRAVRTLREQGRTVEQINQHLTVQPVRSVEVVALSAAPDGPHQAIAPLQTQADSTLYAVLSGRIDAIERNRVSTFTAFAAGVIVSALFFLIVVVLLSLYGG